MEKPKEDPSRILASQTHGLNQVRERTRRCAFFSIHTFASPSALSRLLRSRRPVLDVMRGLSNLSINPPPKNVNPISKLHCRSELQVSRQWRDNVSQETMLSRSKEVAETPYLQSGSWLRQSTSATLCDYTLIHIPIQQHAHSPTSHATTPL